MIAQNSKGNYRFHNDKSFDTNMYLKLTGLLKSTTIYE